MPKAVAAVGGQVLDESKRFPRGVPFIVGNEGAERFSFYGMRAILKVYLASLYIQFVAPEIAGEVATKAASAEATAVTHLFIAGVYAFPMLGAIIADRLLGKYPVIFWLSLVYCGGHGVLAVAGRMGEMAMYEGAEYGFYVGLALIALGSGGIKPCVSANVGDQFTSKNKGLVTTIFQIFYFIINFGSFFSTIITPYLMHADWAGPEVAFGVPGIFMAIATFVFWLGRDRFVRIPPNPGGTLGLLDAISSIMLISPIIAMIAAVFVSGEGFTPPENVGITAAEFYWQFVSSYVSYIAANSWPYFVAAAALFIGGLAIFQRRQKMAADPGFIAMLLYAFQHRGERKNPGESMFEVVRAKFGDDAAEGPPAVLRIVLVFSMVSVFWALFDQHASTWITQAAAMDLTLSVPMYTWYFILAATLGLALYGGIWLFLWISNHAIPSFITYAVLAITLLAGAACGILDSIHGVWIEQELEAAQMSALNPLMVMIIIPALNVLVYKPLEKYGNTVKPLQRMSAGMFLAAIAFASAAILQTRIEGAGPGNVHALWQTIQYMIMTTAEVLVSITGLEFAYTQAPRKMKSTMMGVWLLCVTFGNILVAFLAPMETILPLSQFFWVFTGLMVGAAIVFVVLAYFYKGKTYLQA